MKLHTDKPISLFDLVMGQLNLGSKTKGKKIVEYSTIHINGKAINNPRYMVNPGDEVTLEREGKPIRKIKAPFPILYEDDDLLIAQKPAGILTHGVGDDNWKSFFGMMASYTKEITNGKERIFIVHRLDREVTGLLILAKSEKVQEQLKNNWKSVEKYYYALVEHAPKDPEGTIESWLHEHPVSLKVYSGSESPNAKFAKTHYRTISQEGKYTLLEIKLDTGRKNQIRVHLADMGCPIVGDYRYGASAEIKRQIRLCAFSLSFPHPITGEIISAEVKLPKSFLRPGDTEESYK